jgi:hypothetical protein
MTTISSNSAVNISVTHNANELSSQKPKCYSQSAAEMLKSNLPAADKTMREIDNLLLGNSEDIQDFHCITFIGYSGLGYKDPEGLRGTLKSELERCLLDNPDKQIVAVCGGTSAGIGVIYKLVAEDASLKEKIKCIGIVSECAPENDLVDGDVDIVRVPDPTNSWQTKKTDGDHEYQYMLYLAHKYGGEVMAFGGGSIGYEEVKEAIKTGIETKIYPFEPDSARLQEKLNAGKQYSDLCPLLYHEFGVND